MKGTIVDGLWFQIQQPWLCGVCLKYFSNADLSSQHLPPRDYGLLPFSDSLPGAAARSLCKMCNNWWYGLCLNIPCLCVAADLTPDLLAGLVISCCAASSSASLMLWEVPRTHAAYAQCLLPCGHSPSPSHGLIFLVSSGFPAFGLFLSWGISF